MWCTIHIDCKNNVVNILKSVIDKASIPKSFMATTLYLTTYDRKPLYLHSTNQISKVDMFVTLSRLHVSGRYKLSD